MSLLALLFSYDSVSGDRERGTLRLILSSAVPRDVVLFGKWIGGYLSALFPCTTALLLGILVFVLHPAVELTVMDWWVLIIFLPVAWIYVAIFFSVGVLISVTSLATDTAAIRCLFIWLFFVLIVPNVAPYIAGRFAPTPSAQEMERKYDKIVADTAYNRFKDHGAASKLLSNTKPVDRDEYMRILDRIRNKIEEIEYVNLARQRYALRQVANTYSAQLQSQIRLARIFSYCSPYAVLTDVAAAMANTSGESQIAFLKMVRQYEDEYFKEQYSEGRNIARYGPVDDPLSFNLTTPNLQERIQQSLPGIGLMVVFGIFCFMAGYLLFLRHPI
jgi:ABC-type transport system involved in multi-copper enzyme maturation permease subunit